MEEPVDGVGEFAVAGLAVEISLNVLDGAAKRVKVVVESVELVSSDDDLIRAECQIRGSLARHPVPLPASLATELLRTARTWFPNDHSTTPSTPRRRPPALTVRSKFRHDEMIDESGRRPGPKQRAETKGHPPTIRIVAGGRLRVAGVLLGLLP